VIGNTSPGEMEDVLQEIGKVNGGKEAYTLYGVYAIIAVIEDETSA